jgi:hypothetical protein
MMQAPIFNMSKEHLEKLAHYLESKLKEVREQLELLNPSSDQHNPVKNAKRNSDHHRAITGDKA